MYFYDPSDKEWLCEVDNLDPDHFNEKGELKNREKKLYFALYTRKGKNKKLLGIKNIEPLKIHDFFDDKYATYIVEISKDEYNKLKKEHPQTTRYKHRDIHDENYWRRSSYEDKLKRIKEHNQQLVEVNRVTTNAEDEWLEAMKEKYPDQFKVFDKN